MNTLTIFKEKRSEYGDNKTRYYSVTDGYNGYFEGSEKLTPLKEAKMYAKRHGFHILELKSNSINGEDKKYIIQ